MNTIAFVATALALIIFGLVSARIHHTILTPPMLFTGFGLLIGGFGFGLAGLDIDHNAIHTLAEITLILVLFTDAARIDLKLLKREHDLPIRMLLIGLPLTIVLGAIAAALIFPQFTFWEAALLAAILAPTDAALGQAVVTSSLVPMRIRQALNVESGLNDGIALPVILILLCFASMGQSTQGTAYWVQFGLLQVTLGPVVGIVVGWMGARLIDYATVSKWMETTFQGISALGLAFIAFALAERVGGNGFIAAFCAGLVLGNTIRGLCSFLFEFTEAEGQLLTLVTFMLFGAVMAPLALAHFEVTVWVYALLSLTVIRMLPVALSLIGKHLQPTTTLFLGWFGPRGLASILFALLVVEDAGLAVGEEILAITAATVLLSIVLHGLSALPAAHLYSRRCLSRQANHAAEHIAVSEMPTRYSRPDSP